MEETTQEVKKNGKRAAKEAKKQEERAAKEAKKQEERAAKEAKKREKKAAKEAKKMAKKAAKEAKKGPGLFAKKITSLFIDDSEIKILTMKGKHVVKRAEVKLEPDSVNDGVVADPEATGAKIKALFDEQGLKRKKVIVGLTGLHCLSKIIKLPVLSQDVMPDAVKREAERELPVSLEDLYLSWQVVDVSKEEQKVFLIVYPRTVIDAIVETLNHAGIKPYIMDLAPLALTRIANQKSAIILDVRDSELDLLVMINGIPELVRSLPLQKEVPLKEKLTIIEEELRRTVRFYETQEAQNQPDGSLPVFLSGELADKPELLKSLQEKLGNVITLSRPPLRYHDKLAPGQFMVNVGLILKKTEIKGVAEFSKVNINALPKIYQKVLPIGRVIWPLASAVALALVILGVIQVLNHDAQIDSLTNELSEADNRISLIQTQQQSLNNAIIQLEQKITESQVNYNTLSVVTKILGDKRESVIVDLPLVISSLKDKMTLSAIEYRISSITVSGQTPEKTEVLSYAQTVKDSERFSIVDFYIKINVQNQSIREFTLWLNK